MRQKRKITYENATAIYWLRYHYKEFPLGGGLTITDVFSDNDNINIYMRVTKETAEAIMLQPPHQQHRIANIGCPSHMEPVWQIIEQKQTIYANISCPKRANFIRTDCRAKEWE